MAAGWRSWEQLKESGISPDGMVFLERNPYGPTRAYFEYERTAGGEARVRRKLLGYGSADRGDGCPVLIVCWNDDAESVFQDLGSGMGIPPADHHHQTAGGAWPVGQLRLLVGVRPAPASVNVGQCSRVCLVCLGYARTAGHRSGSTSV